ncbi:transposase family protein [Streptomyces sp. NBC_01264]|uniref:transposase family protein n=1 Tax=Streptomyces sp. NBC_01264 TaxID=2903804 RepID=UPI003D2FA355
MRPDRRWRRPACGVCRRRAPLYDRGRRRRRRSLDEGLLRVYLEADLPRVGCEAGGGRPVAGGVPAGGRPVARGVAGGRSWALSRYLKWRDHVRKSGCIRGA